MPAGGRLLLELVFLLGELHASFVAGRAHRSRDMSEEVDADIVGVTGTRLPFIRAWDGSCTTLTFRSIANTSTCEWGTQPHTLLEHVCEECPFVVISTFQGAATFSSTRGGLTQIYHTASPAETNASAAGPTSGPGQNWSPTSSGKEHLQA